MSKFTYLDNASGAYVEELYRQYLSDPYSLEDSWRRFFEGYEFALSNGADTVVAPATENLSTDFKERAITKLINAYRSRGHLIAKINPIMDRKTERRDLSLPHFGLSEEDLDQEFGAGREIGLGSASLDKIISHLKQTYCSSIGVEFMYCRKQSLRRWIKREMESNAGQPAFDKNKKKDILEKIIHAVSFEAFLQKKYVGKKRFSLEGVESLIPALDVAVRLSAQLGVKEFVLGMAHRGRLNVLVNIFDKSLEQIFSEFEGSQLPEEVKGEGDVKYHMGQSADIITPEGYPVHLSLLPNPSHLEAVNPVVQGVVYAKRMEIYGGAMDRIIPIVLHGDAAITGQGVNYEVANMSRLQGYRNGGTVHIVLNNQLGFTTPNREGRSGVYCTDLAKITESPVFHVNADDPLAVVHAVEMAIRIRQEFHIDVYVDLVGYRRYGHNEGDEPRFTQPIMYDRIGDHPNVQDVFIDELIESGEVKEEEASAIIEEFQNTLQKNLEAVKTHRPELKVDYLLRFWQGIRVSQDSDFYESVDTSISRDKLDTVANSLVTIPETFNIYRKMKKLVGHRKEMYFEKGEVDWGMAELLAYGSLLIEDHPVRLSGQDSQRGTFSHRHVVIKDVDSEEKYVPLNHIQDKQKKIFTFNSPLSEYSVLGFELGFSLARPHTLVIWEAQFGDFVNGAQIIIDQFLSSSEVKWQRMSGLVMLLPHGYEGQGPEHSSARLERFLQLCAQNNMYMANCTTPANFFHLLRRQIHNEFRIPLVVFTPKSLLRHPKVISSVDDLEKGRFQEILDDDQAKPKKVKRVLFCSGKIYYELLARKEEDERDDIAIIRLEQLYPLPMKKIEAIQEKYKKANDWYWVQEEPYNMGAWAYVAVNLDIDFKCASRPESASTATANEQDHKAQQKEVIDTAFE